MKPINQFKLYAGSLGGVTLLAILASIHEQLITVGPWVLDTILATLGSLMVYGGVRVYVSGRRHWLALQEQKQQFSHARSRNELELLGMRAEIHVKLSRLYADPNGNYPIILPGQFISPAEIAGNVLLLPPGQAKGIGMRSVLSQRADSLHDESAQAGELPTEVMYEDIKHLVPRGHVLVGIGYHGVETMPQAVGACVWIVGLSGTGKTSTTVLRVEERAAFNHLLLGVDPHWFKDDSLYHAIYELADKKTGMVLGPGPYADRFAMPMAKTPAESLKVYKAFLGEFYARKNGQRPKPWRPVTLLVDEVGAQMDKATANTAEEKEIIELLPSIARICGQEARNFYMGGIFISQQATGLAWLSKVALMIIVHQLLREAEKKLATNNDPVVMKEMKTWPIGRTYVHGVGFGTEGPRTVQQPYFKPHRIDEGEKILPDDDDQMEDLRPKGWDVYGTPGTPRYMETEGEIETVPDDEADTFFSEDSGEKTGVPSNVRTSPISAVQPPVEQSDASSEDRPKEYRFTDVEIPQFLAAYWASGNIDRACQALRKSAPRYRQHAKEIIKAYNTRQA